MLTIGHGMTLPWLSWAPCYSHVSWRRSTNGGGSLQLSPLPPEDASSNLPQISTPLRWKASCRNYKARWCRCLPWCRRATRSSRRRRASSLSSMASTPATPSAFSSCSTQLTYYSQSQGRSPFITVLAIDPHIIIRGIEQNLHPNLFTELTLWKGQNREGERERREGEPAEEIL